MKVPAFVMIPYYDHKSNSIDLDVLPLVLCKDCRYRDQDNCPMEFYFDNHPAEDYCFCAHGEQKEGV